MDNIALRPLTGNFRLGGDVVSVIIDPSGNILFSDSSGLITTVEGLRISKPGVIKEFPELEHDADWKVKAIDNLKAHAKKFSSQDSKLDYIKSELVKFGYTPLTKQRAGFRPVKFL